MGHGCLKRRRRPTGATLTGVFKRSRVAPASSLRLRPWYKCTCRLGADLFASSCQFNSSVVGTFLPSFLPSFLLSFREKEYVVGDPMVVAPGKRQHSSPEEVANQVHGAFHEAVWEAVQPIAEMEETWSPEEELRKRIVRYMYRRICSGRADSLALVAGSTAVCRKINTGLRRRMF
jgi:hypothetical protein